MDYSIIGGADGPTSVFVAAKLGYDWINIFGVIIVILMLIPNIIYGIKFRKVTNQCQNKFMNIFEQVGRYASMFLMIFNIGILEFSFASVTEFMIYLFGNGILLLAYWIVWILYFVKQNTGKSIVLAVFPTVIFLLSGITLRHWLLIISAVIFGIAHIYVTYQNTKAV